MAIIGLARASARRKDKTLALPSASRSGFMTHDLHQIYWARMLFMIALARP